MYRLRFLGCLLLPLFLFTAFCLKNAPAQQTPPSGPSPQKTPPSKPAEPAPKSDPQAEKTLAALMEAQEPRQLGSAKMDIWQQMTVGGLVLTAEGSYKMGPKHQVRHEMHLSMGGCRGELLTVCDGTTTWESLQIGQQPRLVIKWDMKKVQDALGAPGTMPQVGEIFYSQHGFVGVVPLVKALQARMIFTKQESEIWEDHNGKRHKVFKLTGSWSPELTKRFPSPYPALIPRICNLYIDQEKPHWLYRVEFWGKDMGSMEEKVLFRMEFRNPQQMPLGPEHFTFDPGDATVEDKTQEKIGQIAQARSQQQMQMQKQQK
jgi:hypothetical protein